MIQQQVAPKMGTSSDEWSLYVPNIFCLGCGGEVRLEAFSYWNYEGALPCKSCGPITWIRLEGGQLKESRKVFDNSLLEDLVSPRIPVWLLTTFREAVSNELTAPGLAAVGCRFVIQDALLRKGVEEDRPEKMVSIARSQKLIAEQTFRACSAAVFLGGKGAHPQSSWVDVVGKHEAREALILTRRILLELFPPVTPSKWVALGKAA